MTTAETQDEGDTEQRGRAELRRSRPAAAALPLLALFAFLALRPAPAAGLQVFTGPLLADASFAFTAGAFDPLDPKGDTSQLGLQLRMGRQVLGLRPSFGLFRTGEGALDLAVGLRRDFDLGRLWRVTPAFSFTYYHQGGGEDLGFGLEFLSELEVSVKASDRVRVGVAFSHISNARLSATNPGAESYFLVLEYYPRRFAGI